MSTTASSVPRWDDYDVTSQAYWEDPVAYYQRAHTDHPVFMSASGDSLVFARHEDVTAILQDFETFSSVVMGRRARPLSAELRARMRPEQEDLIETIMVNQLAASDPPLHTRQRRLAQAVFTRPLIRASHDRIHEIVAELIDGISEGGRCDLMQDFAYPLSLRVAGGMLGLPRGDLPRFRAWITEFFIARSALNADPATDADRADELLAAYDRIADAYDYFAEWVAARRADPQADLASAMAALRENDGSFSLSDQEVLAHMIGIVAAGTDTTANLIGSMVRYMTERPELLDELRAEPALWPTAVEEGLRRSSVAPQARRLATVATRIGEVEVGKGTMVVAAIAGANGDPQTFPEPLVFDLHRTNLADHIAFGFGRHFCLGAALARPEAGIALQELYRRLPRLTADLDEPQEFVRHSGPRIRLRQSVRWRG